MRDQSKHLGIQQIIASAIFDLLRTYQEQEVFGDEELMTDVTERWLNQHGLNIETVSEWESNQSLNFAAFLDALDYKFRQKLFSGDYIIESAEMLEDYNDEDDQTTITIKLSRDKEVTRTVTSKMKIDYVADLSSYDPSQRWDFLYQHYDAKYNNKGEKNNEKTDDDVKSFIQEAEAPAEEVNRLTRIFKLLYSRNS